MNILTSPKIAAVLAREHAAARAQRDARAAPGDAPRDRSRPVDFRTSDLHRTGYLAIGPAQGRWLAGLVLARQASEIVEFGTSFGISTLYLAAAAARTQGRVTGSEFHPHKAEKARSNISDAGLSATIHTGDALTTLAGEGPPIDLLFLDGAKELYLPVLRLLQPRLGPGSVIVADNIPLEKDARSEGPTADFNSFVAQEENGFVSTVVGFGRSGMSFSVVCGD